MVIDGRYYQIAFTWWGNVSFWFVFFDGRRCCCCCWANHIKKRHDLSKHQKIHLVSLMQRICCRKLEKVSKYQNGFYPPWQHVTHFVIRFTTHMQRISRSLSLSVAPKNWQSCKIITNNVCQSHVNHNW